MSEYAWNFLLVFEGNNNYFVILVLGAKFLKECFNLTRKKMSPRNFTMKINNGELKQAAFKQQKTGRI